MPEGNESSVLISVDHMLATITINRPKAMNAIDDPTANALRKAIDQVMNDADVRVVAFTGAGDKAFAAGSDLRKLQASDMVDVLNRTIRKLWTEVEQAPKPTIAAVNGHCIGGGLELAMACDLRIASTTARFAITDTRLGFLPGGGAIYRLPKLVGKGKAKEMILLGDPIDAEEAYRIGLVNLVVPPEELPSATRRWADKLLQRAPLALRLGKLAVDVGFESGVAVSSHFENIAQALLCATEDKREGITAFFEKRPPVFKGR